MFNFYAAPQQDSFTELRILEEFLLHRLFYSVLTLLFFRREIHPYYGICLEAENQGSYDRNLGLMISYPASLVSAVLH